MTKEQLAFTFVHEAIRKQAAIHPDQPAVIDQAAHAIDYEELCARSRALAQRLQQLGIKADDRVAIWMDRSIDFIVSILGVLEAGAAYVPIDTSFPEERVLLILENSGARVVITDLEACEKVQSKLKVITPACSEVESTSEVVSKLDPENLAYVIYTSGSTGVPKGVAMSHRGLSRLIDWQLNDGPKALTTLQFTPVCFDVTLQELFSTLCSGGTLVLASEDWRRNPKLLLSELTEKGIERLFLPYVALQQLAKAAESGGGRSQTLQHVITAGEQLIVTEAITSFFSGGPECRLENQYGPTEAHLVTSFNLPSDSATWHKVPSIGVAVTDVDLYILDEKLDRMPAGAPGELYVAGVGLARCYVNAPDLTAERFLPNPFSPTSGARMYKTGDVVRVNNEGLLDFIGRADHQIKVRGFRVEPAEVELAITNHPHVQQAAVRLQTVADDVNILVGYIVKNGSPLTAPELSEYLQKSLPDYMVPSRLVFLESLPLTSTGKVDQQKLNDLSLAPGTDAVPPTEISRVEMLRAIWERVLGHDEFELEDDFFEIGGDSLLATWVVTEIGNSVGREFDLSMLLENSTIPGIARTLEELALRPLQSRQPSQVVTLRPNSSKRLLFLVHPLGGEPVPYRALARSIKSPVRVVGLCWRPTEARETTLEEMAAIHLTQMRAIQPEGPYLIAGWSFGGVLAYEIAQQLIASGAEVEFFGLIDANPVRDSISGRLASDGSLLAKFTEALAEIDRKLTAGETDLQAYDNLYGLMGHSIAEGVTAKHLRQIMEVTKDNLAAVANYRPAPYTGLIDLFQPEDSPAAVQQLLHAELCAFSQGPLRLHPIPGNHYSILRSPLVDNTARAIDAALTSIARSSKSSTEAVAGSV